MSGADLVLVGVLAALAAAPQNVTGFGFALLLAPFLLLVADAKDTVVIVNILGTLLVAVMVLQLRREVAWRTTAILFFSALAGMPLGLAVLLLVSANVLQAMIAVAVIVSTVALLRGFVITHGNVWTEAAVGVASGVLRTSTSTSGPPVIIYLQGRRMPRHAFRASLSAYFFASGVVSVSIFALAGRLDRDVGLSVLAGLPGIAAGMLAGAVLAGRVDETWFQRIVVALLFVSAVAALVSAFAG